MADYAHIESLDALKRFRVALIKFVEGVTVGLDEAEAEIQRTDLWLKQEQPAYWKQQVALRTELYTRAKSALKRKQLQTTGMNNRPSCVDELKELARAEQALEEAQHKQAEVRRWSRLFEQEGFSYTAASQRLRTATQTGLPRALAQLDAMIEAIEAYGVAPQLQRQGSTMGASPAGVAAPEGAARIARAAPAAIAAYARLRTRTPPAATRDEIPLHSARIVAIDTAEAPPATPAAPGASSLLEFLEATRSPPLPDDKVILAAGAADQPRIYLERTLAATPEDSGWHVGSLGDGQQEPGQLVAVRVHELLAERPFLAQFLAFPPGWLVVLNHGALEAILDPDDALRWYGGEMHPIAAACATRPGSEDGAITPGGADDPPEARAE